MLVGISWQTPVEKYLDNADDKRLLNLICKLEGWNGAERKEGRPLQPSFSRCWQDEKGRIQVYGLFAVFNGGWERGSLKTCPRVFCQFVAHVVSYKTIFPDLFYSFRKNKIRNSNCLRVYYFRCARVGSRHSWISAANIPIQEYWLLVLFRDDFRFN